MPDYLRVDAGLDYSFNDHFELSTEALFYITHGLGNSSQDGYGIGELQFGSRYVFEQFPNPASKPRWPWMYRCRSDTPRST